MAQPRRRRRVMIIAGEASGDLHGAKLVRALQARDDDLAFAGIGGQAMAGAGVEIAVDAAELAVVGITEALFKAPTLLKGLATAKRLLAEAAPDLLILIDFPDFNLRVAAAARKRGIPVLYYISPQIWAWRPGRVRKIGARVDHVAVILPFEADFYRRHDIPVTFVGHPLLDGAAPAAAPPVPSDDRPATIGLLPGSREREVVRHLPVMLSAAALLRQTLDPAPQFVVSAASSVAREIVTRSVAEHPAAVPCRIVDGGVEQVFQMSRLVVAASGTVTLEAAIAGTPMVIIYKVSPLSYWLGRLLVRVPHIGLVNLIADREVVPELVQGDASPEKIAAAVRTQWEDPAHLARLRRELAETRRRLGGAGASQRVAAIALAMLQEKHALA